MTRIDKAKPQQTRPERARWRWREHLAVGVAIAAISLVALPAIAPPPTMSAAAWRSYVSIDAQAMNVSDAVTKVDATRGTYTATDGVETYVRVGTNHSWAKLVLLYAGLPVTENNVTVFTRWMRQENGANNWWNRNNPLNNGWGSGGGGGTGTYASLTIAAQKAAEALTHSRGYSGIVAAFAADSPTAVTEAAIWASPWASGHYANGGHWHYTPVPEVTAPAGAW